MTKSNQSSLDIADHLSRGEYDWCPEAETRLREQHDFIRQQHAEIEALKKEAALQRLSDFTQEAECKHGVDDGACKECYQEATEPVAWIIDAKMTDCDDNFIWNTGNYPDWQVKHWIPLYTHPVKELTIEEIEEVSKEIFKGYKNFYHYQINFARAILRKAQEK